MRDTRRRISIGRLMVFVAVVASVLAGGITAARLNGGPITSGEGCQTRPVGNDLASTIDPQSRPAGGLEDAQRGVCL